MTTVAYVLGKGRSGSTLLDRLLGEVDGCVSVGEVWRLWDWRREPGHLCGCGRELVECPFWEDVLGRAFGPGRDDDAIRHARDEVLRWGSLPRLLRDPRGGRRWPARERWVDVSTRVADAVAAVSGAQVVVDSSKWPFDPVVLGAAPALDARAVHLVRDPRAVAYSWTRHKDAADRPDGTMPRFSPLSSSASWLARNLAAEAVRRRTSVPWQTLRYEDLVRDPRGELARLVAAVGLAGARLPFVDERTARVGAHHMVGGNPSKSVRDAVTIRPDLEWVSASTPAGAAAATAVGAVLMGRYGYPLRWSRPVRDPAPGRA